MPMEVIGYDDEEVEGYEGPEGYEVEGADVMGADVMGHHGRYHRMGAVWGPAQYPVVGAGWGQGAQGNRALVRVNRPPWRARQLAPGVIAPDQGLLPLPMHGTTGTDTFTATLNPITFQGQIQKPFRGERLLVRTVRTGTSATGILTGQLFIGTDLQQLDIQGFDIESVGAVTGFGVRLTMKPAQPGVFIRLAVTVTPALTASDTILTSITLLGRNVH